MYTKAEISLDSLTNNLNVIKGYCAGKELCAVVKADAYGHCAAIVVPRLRELGVDSFAVSCVAEAENIRRLAPESRILILGACNPAHAEQAERLGCDVAIADVVHARAISEQMARLGKRLNVHVKTDTGMSRFGATAAELPEILRLPGLNAVALFTHFAVADSDEPGDVAFTDYQQSKLVELSREYNLPHHSQNSAGLRRGDFGGFMVRAGLALYGYADLPGLREVMSLKSVVGQVREVAAGDSVGYGRAYRADSPRKIAVVCAGYADGYSRLHSNRGAVAIRGRLAPVRGRVCMDYLMADVSDIPGVVPGDEVTLYESDCGLSIVRIAEEIGTIPYEVTCAVSARCPRVVVGG